MRSCQMKKISVTYQFLSLLNWSFIRHKSLILLCSVIQFFMTIALVYGYSLIIADDTVQTVYYLASGSVTIGMITIGCTVSAQSISSDKRDGIVSYIQTLPVLRSLILLSDLLIWTLTALIGVGVSIAVVYLKFQILPQLSLATFLILPLVLMTMISMGFAIAYWSTPSTMTLITQLLLMIGLLFSPIMYPAERIPEVILRGYHFLPFIPAGDLIRETVYLGHSISVIKLVVLLLWLVATALLSVNWLNRQS